MIRHRLGLVALLAAGLSGCGTTSAPPPRYYTLSAPPVEAAEPPAASLFAYVGPVTVPDAVDRPQMVLRATANQVELSEGHRWAEPLKGEIPRVIADNLMRELKTQRISGSRVAAGIPADYRIAIDVQRFDSSRESGASVDALWIIRKGNGDAHRTGRTEAREPAAGGEPADLAAAHSRALARIARDIAAAIRH